MLNRPTYRTYRYRRVTVCSLRWAAGQLAIRVPARYHDAIFKY